MSPSASPQVNCPNCGTALALLGMAATLPEPCPRCRRPTRLLTFPALFRPKEAGAVAPAAMPEGEATCFYHPEKRAHVACDGCGRFLCALCDLDVYDAHLCPQCLEAGERKRTIKALERGRTRYDQIVSALLILPLVFCWFVLPITALVALGLVIWKWNAPVSLVANTRLHLVVAAILAVIEFVGSLALWWVTIQH
jgi:ribosomal protein S27E